MTGIERGGPRRPVRAVRGAGAAVGLTVMALVAAFLAVGPVAAHGGIAELRVGAERVNPGGTVRLDGDMTADGPVVLSLVGGQAGAWDLGAIEADGQGHFQTVVTIPADVPNGGYRVRAVATTGEASAVILVDGPPVGSGDDGQAPGQDEVFAGVGTMLPGAATASGAAPARPGASPPATSGASSTAGGEGDPFPFLAAALALGALGLLVVRSRRSTGSR